MAWIVTPRVKWGRTDSRAGCHRLAAAHRILGRLQDTKHARAFLAVGQRPGAGGDALKKMFAFVGKRFRLLHRHGFGIGAVGFGYAVAPVNVMGIQYKFALPRLAIVEHGHTAVADDHKLLFLERVQPGNENVGALTAGEGKVRCRHVGDLAMQVARAGRRDLDRVFAGERQDHRDIVRRKTPQDVLLAAYAAEVQAVGIDVLKAAQRPRRNHYLQPLERRVVTHEVADHKDAPASRRVLAQAFGIGGVERQRLLDKHVFAGGDRFLGQGKMLDRGRRDGDCVNSWVSKYIVPGTHADAVFLGRPRSCLAVAIANRRQGAQLGEIPHRCLPQWPQPATAMCGDRVFVLAWLMSFGRGRAPRERRL